MVVEGIDVARGPGSVAYGSDAFGGVISVRTRRVVPGAPLSAQFSGTLGAGIPEKRGAFEVSKGLTKGGVLFAAHTRDVDDWDSPIEEVFNSGFNDHGFLGRFEHAAGPGTFSVSWQSDFGRDIERPRNNSRTVRFFYPTENSHRFTTGYEAADVAGFRRVGFTGFLGTFDQRTDQDRFATATTGRTIERADISAKDFHVRGFGERLLGKARVEIGVDINGRFDLNAIDDLITHDLSGNVISTRPNVSVDSASRRDTGVYASIDSALARYVSVSAGIRGDYVTTENSGGYFGDRSTEQRRRLRVRVRDRGHAGGRQRDRTDRPRLSRSGVVRSLLPRTDRARVHHRQPGSRSGDEHAVRPRGPLYGSGVPSGRVLLPL